jgi:hypothetical protein
MVYAATGFLAGIISGMGIGGGAVLIPALGIFLNMGQREAQHINLLYFIPTAAAAVFSHIKQGNIEKQGLTKIIIFGLLGAAVGAFVAFKLDASWLRKGFGVFLLGTALYEFFRKGERNGIDSV